MENPLREVLGLGLVVDKHGNYIAGPADAAIPMIAIQGVPVVVVADLPGGGFLQIVSGENPVAVPTASVTIAKGAMLLVLDGSIAEKIRPGLRKGMPDEMKALGQGGAILAPSKLET